MAAQGASGPYRLSDITFAASMVIGYVIGGLPFPYWLARLKGVDFFTAGTRNPGAANLLWEVGWHLGVLAVILDLAKGAAAVLVSQALGLTDEAAIAGGLAAVIGNWHSPFLRLRGGEALVTCVGIAVAAAPKPTVMVIAFGLPLLAWWRNTGMAVGVCWLFVLPVATAMELPLPVTTEVSALEPLIAVRSRIRARGESWKWARGVATQSVLLG